MNAYKEIFKRDPMVEFGEDQANIISSLKQQGFSEEIISLAMQSTQSRKIEDIVDRIEEIQERKLELDAQKAEIKQKLEESERNKVYLKHLRDQIYADRLEREQRKNEIQPETKVEKSVNITELGECRVKVRYEGTSIVIGFNKNDTASHLFNEIRKRLGIPNFKVFLVNPAAEVHEGGNSLSSLGLIPNGAVIVHE